MARHCYSIILQKKIHPDPCPVDGLDVRDDLTKEQGESMEDLVAVPLNDEDVEHTVQFGSNLGDKVSEQLIAFLRKNANIFT